MTKDQINYANMFQTTDLILTKPENAAIYAGLPAFVRGQASLHGSINLIGALAQAQGSPLTGITLDKDRLQRSLINRVAIVAGAAGAYAFEAKNHTAAAKFDLKEGTRKATTEAIAAEIERTLANLKNVLDRLILQFQADHPAFTTAYAAARKIVNSGNSHAAPAPAPPTP